MSNIFTNISPADCDAAFLLPALPVKQNCTNFPTFLSQVCDIWIRPNEFTGTELITWTNSTTATVGAADAIDNTNADNTKYKWLVGSGSVDVPDKTVVEVFKGKDITTLRRYTLPFTIYNVSDLQREYLLRIQDGWTGFRFQYRNRGKSLFGSANAQEAGGIQPLVADVDFPQGGGRTDNETAVLTLVWESKRDPDRAINFTALS